MGAGLSQAMRPYTSGYDPNRLRATIRFIASVNSSSESIRRKRSIHEPPSFGIAAILQSSFIEWWFRHVVYTKQFVTSKDFDQAYIRQIRIPTINYDNSKFLESKSQSLIENFEILPKNNFSSDLSKCFILISALYQKYQALGEEYKKQILSHITNPSLNSQEKFIQFNKIYKDSQKNYFNKRKEYNKIYTKLKKVKAVIDELVFSFYEISESEKNLIEESETLRR